MNKPVYMDYAAATPLDPEVLAIMQPYFTKKFYNASAAYLAAKDVAQTVHGARAAIAKLLGSRPAEIIFTAGGTEANNLAIQGIMAGYPEANVCISAIEHDSVLEPARLYDAREIAVLPNGVVDSDDLKKKIDDHTVLVSVLYANNEIGTIQPLAEIGRLVKQIRAERLSKGNSLPLYFHTDACQAGNYLHLLVDKLGVDLMTINAGKVYGPKQCGALYVKAGTPIKPLILGGGQEWGMRSGTENVANIVGFAAALEKAQSMREAEGKRLQALRQYFISELERQVPQAVPTTRYKQVLPNNVHITIPSQDNERLMMGLDEQGVQCAVGSACSASSDEPSHVLAALGLSDTAARSSLRFTMGRDTTKKEVARTVDILAKLIV